MFSSALRISTQQVARRTFPNVAAATSSGLRSFATYKTSTGLVGLAVDPNGKETLVDISAQVLSAVQKIPAESQYRIDVEKWFTYINKVATETEDIIDIENEIDLGQIEEVIVMAQDELSLVDYYYEMKGWELVEEAKAEADAIVEEMADSIFFSSPEARASYVKRDPAA